MEAYAENPLPCEGLALPRHPPHMNQHKVRGGPLHSIVCMLLFVDPASSRATLLYVQDVMKCGCNYHIALSCINTAIAHSSGPIPELMELQSELTAKAHRLNEGFSSSSSFECPICLEEALFPHIVQPCGHVFCKVCLDSLRSATFGDESQLQCPMCRTPWTGDAFHARPVRAELIYEYCCARLATEEGSKIARLWFNLATTVCVVGCNKRTFDGFLRPVCPGCPAVVGTRIFSALDCYAEALELQKDFLPALLGSSIAILHMEDHQLVGCDFHGQSQHPVFAVLERACNAAPVDGYTALLVVQALADIPGAPPAVVVDGQNKTIKDFALIIQKFMMVGPIGNWMDATLMIGACVASLKGTETIADYRIIDYLVKLNDPRVRDEWCCPWTWAHLARGYGRMTRADQRRCTAYDAASLWGHAVATVRDIESYEIIADWMETAGDDTARVPGENLTLTRDQIRQKANIAMEHHNDSPGLRVGEHLINQIKDGKIKSTDRGARARAEHLLGADQRLLRQIAYMNYMKYDTMAVYLIRFLKGDFDNCSSELKNPPIHVRDFDNYDSEVRNPCNKEY